MENARRKCPNTHNPRTLPKKKNRLSKYFETKNGRGQLEAITENLGMRCKKRNRPTKSKKICRN